MYEINYALATGDRDDLVAVDSWSKFYVGNFIDGEGNDMEEWDRLSDYITGEIETGNRVLICCEAGISRSNAMALTVMTKMGYDFHDAYNFIKERVKISNIEVSLLSDIMRYYGIISI